MALSAISLIALIPGETILSRMSHQLKLTFHGHTKMNKIWQKIKELGSWAWKVIIVIAVLLGIWAGYVQIFKQQPSIFSQIISEINVLDINEPLQDLQILFQQDNIQERNLNLRIYRVKIENNGSTNITQNDFDQNENWGIKIEKGRIIETRLLDSNAAYIKENLSPQIQGDNVVQFNKIIFDKGASFNVELLVLHDKETFPVLYRVGKIAGIQENESEILPLEHSEPFLTIFFYGNLFVNFARFVVYGVAAILVLIAVFFVIIKVKEKREREAQRPQPPQQPS